MVGHDLYESAEDHSETKRHFFTWESNFPALCKKVRQISCSPRISHELFSKHSNTPQPTSPAFTRQCWISAEIAERVRMWFVTLVKGSHLSLILRFLWAYTLNAHLYSNLSFIQDCYLLKGLLSLERSKVRHNLSPHMLGRRSLRAYFRLCFSIENTRTVLRGQI